MAISAVSEVLPEGLSVSLERPFFCDQQTLPGIPVSDRRLQELADAQREFLRAWDRYEALRALVLSEARWGVAPEWRFLEGGALGGNGEGRSRPHASFSEQESLLPSLLRRQAE